ncbi:uncharacterized protein LOC127566465 isoform X2 [Pristis pectinata]|uniref:uncharacterized protein LOC127566465 isoform X2 n=1 Tax=Pristis pectinata TaxID=685728 RepID=UPI00223D6B43|nr:uncharacterized protein LOC127566465 isoform X2 [Pristis pectinata]
MNTAVIFLLVVAVTTQTSDTHDLGKLRLSPDRADRIYFDWESMVFTCASDYQHSFSEFELHNGRELLPIKPQVTNSMKNAVTFTINVAQSRSQYYQCIYKSTLSQRSLAESDILEITVVDHKQLRLSTDRADKVYLKGESIEVTCESNDEHPRSDFRLYNAGYYSTVESPTPTSLTKMVTFTITKLEIGKHSYYCTAHSGHSNTETIEVLGTRTARLTTDRADKVFLKGESVNFTCDFHNEHNISTFRLYDGKYVVLIHHQTAISRRNSHTFTISLAKIGAEVYFCQGDAMYSESVRITVLGIPKLRLSADRADGVYLRGETVTLTCEADYEHRLSSFQFYDGERRLPFNHRENVAWGNAVNFTITDAETGPHHYLCLYTTRKSTEQSEGVNIIVVDLPIPRISVNPSDAFHGGLVVFTCTNLQEIPEMTVYLYGPGGLNDSVSQPPTPQNNSVTFKIKNVVRDQSGNYTCGYEAVVNGRRLQSALSDSVHLSVRAQSFRALITAFAVLPLIPICALLGIYCWKKRKARSRGGMTTRPPPQDQIYDNVLPHDTARGYIRATPAPLEDEVDDDVVYAHLTMEPQPKRCKDQQETFQVYDDGETIYAAVKP